MKASDIQELLQLLDQAEALRQLAPLLTKKLHSFGPELRALLIPVMKGWAEMRVELLNHYVSLGVSREEALAMCVADIAAIREMARALTVQQRSEILGAPFGYEHLFLLPDGTTGDAAERIRRGHFVVVHDVMSPINLQAAVKAMSPDVPLGPALHVRPSGEEWKGELLAEWRSAADHQRLIVGEAIEKSRDLLPRFAVFSLAPIPLAAHLGFLFSDRVEVRAFQFDRDRSEWSWPTNDDNETVQISTAGIPPATVQDACEVALRISISARVSEADAKAGAPAAEHHVEIHVPDPSKTWLSSGQRLQAAKKQIRETLAALRDRFPECSKVHVFAAVPTPVAIALGQAVNPRMDPPIALYEYSRQRSPRYRFALTLEEAS